MQEFWFVYITQQTKCQVSEAVGQKRWNKAIKSTQLFILQL